MPLLPPVTSAIFPSSFPMVFLPLVSSFLVSPCLFKSLNPTPGEFGGFFQILYQDCSAVRSIIPHHGSVWMVQVLSTGRAIFPGNGESHITAVCGWFRSFLPDEPSSEESGIPHHGSVWLVQVLSTGRAIFRGIGNPTSRQVSVRSSPF